MAASLLALGVLAGTMGRDFLPYLDEGSIWLQVQMPPGITLDKARDMADALRSAALEFPEVSYIVTQTGRNDDGTDYWTPSHIEASVGLHPYGEWKSGLTKQQLIAKMAARFDQLPGYSVGFMQPMIDGVQDKLSGAHSDHGKGLRPGPGRRPARGRCPGGRAGESARRGRRGRGRGAAAAQPAHCAGPRGCRALRHQCLRVAQLISTGVGGASIGQLYVGERSYDMAVRFTPDTRSSPEAIGALRLSAANGAQVPLADVARITTTVGQSVIVREGGERHILVKLNVRGRDLAGFLRMRTPPSTSTWTTTARSCTSSGAASSRTCSVPRRGCS